MQQVAAGDSRAFRALVDAHLPALTRHTTRLLGNASEAEEVTQETFLKLWQGAAGWKPEARLSTWLHRIAHNACIDRLRRRRERGGMEMDEQVAPQPRTSVVFAQKQRAERLHAALSELPERQRAALSLVHFEGLSQREAAEVMDVTVDALESLLARARRGLKPLLKGV